MSRGKAFGKSGTRWSTDTTGARRPLQWRLFGHRIFSGRAEAPDDHPKASSHRAILRDRYGNLAICSLCGEPRENGSEE